MRRINLLPLFHEALAPVLLVGIHATYCFFTLWQTRFLLLANANPFVYLKFVYEWARAPFLFLQGNTFPALPLMTYGVFMKMFSYDYSFAFAATEIFVSSLGVFLLYRICRELDFPPFMSFLVVFSSIVHVDHFYNATASAYNDNFFLTATFLSVWGWLRYVRTRSVRYMYVSAVGACLTSMSRWEGLILPLLFYVFLLHDHVASKIDRGALFLHRIVAGVLAGFYGAVLLGTAGSGMLQAQVSGYQHIFQQQASLVIFFQELFCRPQRTVIIFLSVTVLASYLILSPRSVNRSVWKYYLLYPATLFLAYLVFTMLEYGTPKSHLWYYFALSFPILFMPVQFYRETAGSGATRLSLSWMGRAFLRTLYPLSIVLYFLYSFNRDVRAEPSAPVVLAPIEKVGVCIKSLWRHGVIREEEKIAVFFLHKPSDRRAAPYNLLGFYFFKTPEHIHLRDIIGDEGNIPSSGPGGVSVTEELIGEVVSQHRYKYILTYADDVRVPHITGAVLHAETENFKLYYLPSVGSADLVPLPKGKKDQVFSLFQ
ncbi:MAG TPA: hypothetical protein PK876_06310 [Elusimicrobiota bacterium]|nr:hypothetical protein [Elusimicrobiota bacterium]